MPKVTIKAHHMFELHDTIWATISHPPADKHWPALDENNECLFPRTEE